MLRLLPLIVYLGLAAAAAFLSVEPPFATPWWPVVILGLSGVVVVVLRHRYPTAMFAAAMVLSVLSFAVGSAAEAVLLVLAVSLAGISRSAGVAWICFGIALVAGIVGAFVLAVRLEVGPPIFGLQPSELPRDLWLDWANIFVIIAGVLLISSLLGMNVGHRRRHIAQLTERAQRLARERDQQAETARALERERIAREMHDVIAHSLSVMIAISDGASAAVSQRPDAAQEAMARVAATGRRTLSEVRRLLGAVSGDRTSSAEHTPQPDASQLESLVAEFVTVGLPARLTMTGTPSADPGLGLTVYRIVQESLTNVLRHSEAVQAVMVNVTWTDEQVVIVVEDQSSEAPPHRNIGRGLLGMQERVALYNGVIEAGPQRGGGWRVCAQLQCEDR